MLFIEKIPTSLLRITHDNSSGANDEFNGGVGWSEAGAHAVRWNEVILVMALNENQGPGSINPAQYFPASDELLYGPILGRKTLDLVAPLNSAV